MSSRLSRIQLVTIETFREILLYNRWFQLSLLGLILLVLGIQGISQLPLGASSAKLIYDLGQGVVLLSLGLVQIISLVSLLSKDLERGTLYTYLSSGLGRSEYLVGRCLGCWLSIAAVAFVVIAVLGLLVGKEIADLSAEGFSVFGPKLRAWIQLYCFLLQQWLVLGALVVFLVVLSGSFLFPVVLSMLLWFTSMFASSAGGWNETSSGLAHILGTILPRFDIGNVSGNIWYGASLGLSGVWSITGFGLFYAILLLTAAVYLFNRREL